MDPDPVLRRQSLACPVPKALPWLLPLLLVGGCSGTPFGEALSRSFSGPADPPAAGTQPPGAGTQPPGNAARGGSVPATSPLPAPSPLAAPKPGAVPAVPPAPARSAAGSSPRSGPGSAAGPRLAPPQPPAQAAPYRVTIRLPQADPAAPAEVVTQALRAAGVPFEVETIERMGAGASAGPTPAAGPAAAAEPVAPASPAVRPAPPPR
jgi:hypothetical protein